MTRKEANKPSAVTELVMCRKTKTCLMPSVITFIMTLLIILFPMNPKQRCKLLRTQYFSSYLISKKKKTTDYFIEISF